MFQYCPLYPMNGIYIYIWLGDIDWLSDSKLMWNINTIGEKYEKSWDFDEILMGFDVFFCYMMRHCWDFMGYEWDAMGYQHVWDLMSTLQLINNDILRMFPYTIWSQKMWDWDIPRKIPWGKYRIHGFYMIQPAQPLMEMWPNIGINHDKSI